MATARDILYGWAPGAHAFAALLQHVSGMTDVRPGPIVTDGARPTSNAICVASRRRLHVTIRYPADGAEQIVFARRAIDADPILIEAAVTRLWNEYSRTMPRDPVAQRPRKEGAAMPVITRDDVHPNTVALAQRMETLSSVRSTTVGPRKTRFGRNPVREPCIVPPGQFAKKVLVIVPVPGGIEEVFLFPQDPRMIDVTYRDAVALLDGKAHADGTAATSAPQHDGRPKPEPPRRAENASLAETLCERINGLRSVETASLGPPEPRMHPGPPPPPSVKKLAAGDTAITVAVYDETHYRKIHVRPLIEDELHDVHQKVCAVVGEHAGIPPSQDGTPHEDDHASPQPQAQERTDPMGRPKSPPTRAALTPKEEEIYKFLLGVAGKTPDKTLQERAKKKLGDSVTFQWFALRKLGLIEKTPDGYLVHKAMITVKQRGSSKDKKGEAPARRESPKPKPAARASASAAQPKSKDPLHAAVAFFTEHPELLERELFEEAGKHLAYLDKHNWKLVLKDGEISLAPASKG